MAEVKQKRRSNDNESNDDEERRENKDRKKMRKKAEKVAKMLGYTDDNNPFGDSNLLQPFVWGKKKEKEKFSDKREENSEIARLKLITEIESVRKRRIDRENELAEIERLRDEEQRLREASMYSDWQKKEEDFHLEQTKERSRIRLLGNREKPIDTIAKNVLLIEAAASVGKRDETEYSAAKNVSLLELDVELRNPLSVVENTDLSEEELRQLADDVTAYLQLERNHAAKVPMSAGSPSYEAFWEALHVIVKAELLSVRGNVRGLHAAVEGEIQQLLAGKTPQELTDMQTDIERDLANGRSKDTEYWERLLEEVRLQRARAVVTDTHIGLLQKQLDALTSLREQAIRLKPPVAPTAHHATRRGEGDLDSIRSDRDRPQDQEEQMAARDEVALPGTTYWWQDKYRPRKPRYLNRVKTGWDWNKYNQTHYDFDSPPPKVIQGYKFTIFYPDLIDKNVTPRYVMEASGDSQEFVIIRFSAGPPYEDLAFKIINKEWDVNRKSGFRSVFERGVLQLHFNFKRSFYRR